MKIKKSLVAKFPHILVKFCKNRENIWNFITLLRTVRTGYWDPGTYSPPWSIDGYQCFSRQLHSREGDKGLSFHSPVHHTNLEFSTPLFTPTQTSTLLQFHLDQRNNQRVAINRLRWYPSSYFVSIVLCLVLHTNSLQIPFVGPFLPWKCGVLRSPDEKCKYVLLQVVWIGFELPYLRPIPLRYLWRLIVQEWRRWQTNLSCWMDWSCCQ